MSVPPTSVAALQDIVDSGLLGQMQKNVLRALAEHGPATGSELDEMMSTPSAHKRLTELEEMGTIRSTGLKICKVTQREVLAWEVTGHAPVAPPSKPGDRPTKRELGIAVEELRSILRRLKLHDPSFVVGPELAKTGQWLAAKVK